MVIAACSTSPQEQEVRERAAAGIRVFEIRCSKDLWERTGGKHKIRGTITGPQSDGLITVNVSGPQLVDFIQALDVDAHPFKGSGKRADPLAIRMYNAIAARLDTVKPGSVATEPVPAVVINDAIPASTPTASTAKATPSPNN